MIGILVAVSPEGVIGKDNKIPWHYSTDLKRFKKLTVGKTIVMGRKTWESLPTKPLPDRRNIVITKSKLDGVECFKSIKEAMQNCKGDVWFVGGYGIYKEALDVADIIDMTLVPDNISGEGCVNFPELGNEWEAGDIEALENDDRLKHKIYTRRV